MNINTEEKYLTLFENYYNSFKSTEEKQIKNFKIKRDHSFRVAELMKTIALKEKLNEDVKKLAFITGLFHDIGRFCQYDKYKTFNDNVSVDHADLSVEVFEKEIINVNVDEEEIKDIGIAIYYHNKFEIPKELSPRVLLLSRLLRDADKLDILMVLTDYYENRGKEANHTLTWELPDDHKISEEVAKVILLNKQIPKKIIVNRLDLKVFQMSWVFDLNFKFSFYNLSENRYIERIYSTLPKSEKIIEFYRGVKIFIDNQVYK